MKHERDAQSRSASHCSPSGRGPLGPPTSGRGMKPPSSVDPAVPSVPGAAVVSSPVVPGGAAVVVPGCVVAGAGAPVEEASPEVPSLVPSEVGAGPHASATADSAEGKTRRAANVRAARQYGMRVLGTLPPSAGFRAEIPLTAKPLVARCYPSGSMTTNRGLVELLSRASVPTSRVPTRLRDVPVTASRDRIVELEALLHMRDGFRTLGGALYVRPSVTVGAARGVEDWNQLTSWRLPYKKATELFFFAEDMGGRQFAIHRNEVVTFEPRNGTFEHCAFRLSSWADQMVDDPDALGAARVAEWTEEHGPLGTTDRFQTRDPLAHPSWSDAEVRVMPDSELMLRFARRYRERITAAVPSAEEPAWWWEDGGTSTQPGGA
jgi:hypothetical protein